MIRLIFNIIFLIILAVFVAMNMSYETSINLFTLKMENVSVVAVVLLSIVAGVLYSFLFYVTSYLGRLRKERIHKKADTAKKKEQELKNREKSLDETVQQRVSEEKEKAGLNPPAKEGDSGGLLNKAMPKFLKGGKKK